MNCLKRSWVIRVGSWAMLANFPSNTVGKRLSWLMPAAMLLVTGCGSEAPAVEYPDVVLICCDTLRNDRLSCYGYPRATSPVIDEFAASGVLCEDVTCQWPWTLPSMVSMFQGQYITAYRDALNESTPVLPELFQQAGYRTVGIVANCIVDDSQGFDRGFDHFDCLSCWNAEGKEDPSARDIVEVQRLVRESVAELLAEEDRPPLFLFVHAYDPHDPYSAHSEFNQDLPPRDALGVEPEGYWESTLAERQPEPAGGDRARALKDMSLSRGRYDQEVRYFDRGVGEMLADLRTRGLGDDTLFALVSDHGEGLWDNLSNEPQAKFAKLPPKRFFYRIHGANGYQSVTETPFVLWGGAVPRGVRLTQAVENVDLFPTLLELADIAPPAGLDGRSLVPLFRGAAVPWREYAYCYGSQAASIRHVESGYKLIVHHGISIENGRDLELYDLNADPHERTNLAEREPERLKSLIETYQRWLADHPAVSTTSERGAAEQSDAARELLDKKLKSLGYTDSETGRPGD